jgi:hypothetical protein
MLEVIISAQEIAMEILLSLLLDFYWWIFGLIAGENFFSCRRTNKGAYLWLLKTESLFSSAMSNPFFSPLNQHSTDSLHHFQTSIKC